MREHESFEKPRLRQFEISNLIKIRKFFSIYRLSKILQQGGIESAVTEEDEYSRQ